MAIRISHTPYRAVGQLAEAAGQAQQAVREQDYSFRASQQAKQINATLQAQRERIGAEMEMQERSMEQQKIQFEKNLELQNAQVAAQESATHYNYLTRQQELQQQAEQFEESMAAKEQSFQLESAMRDRQLKIAEQTSDLAVDRFLSDQELRQNNMELWRSLEGTIDPDIYMNGVLAIQSGQLPQLPDPQKTKLMTEAQRHTFDLKRQQMYIKQKTYEQKIAKEPLDDDSREMFAKIAERTLPSGIMVYRASTPQARMDSVVSAYEQYTNAINYGALGEAQKTEADAIFTTLAQDVNLDPEAAQPYMESIRNKHWRYTPVKERAEGYLQVGSQPQTSTIDTGTPTVTHTPAIIDKPPKGEGRQITGDVVSQYMQQARGNAAIARKMARNDGWEF